MSGLRLVLGSLVLVLLLVPRAARGADVLAPPTWERVAMATGQVTAGSQATWEAFLGQTPKWIGVCANSLAALDIHAKLSAGDGWGAARSFVEYGGGVLLSDWAAAGGPPVGATVAVFSAYVAANDFIRDRWFIPSLVDSLQAAYDQARTGGETADQAWEAVRYGQGIQPVLAEVKRRVVRPRRGLDPNVPDGTKANRVAEGQAAGRTIRVTWIPKDRWSLGKDLLIRHKGTEADDGPRFTRIIDIELTGDPKAARESLLYEITRLNERYRDQGKYMDSAGLTQVTATLDRLLARVSDGSRVGEEMDDEAQAYVARMLEVRYARAYLTKGLDAVARTSHVRLASAVEAYADWLALQPPEPEGPPFLDLPCCRYWHVVDGQGHDRITGSYVTPKGTRVAYTSGTIANYVPAMPHAGLVALKSGAGYHIYFETTGSQGTVVVVTKLGEQVETLFHERVARWSCQDMAPDMAWLRCRFERTIGSVETLTLQ
jgi:hypothetical protein